MSKSALLVIDMQVAMVEEAHQPQPVLEQINTLIARARAADVPVVYVQHEEEHYPPMNYGAPTWEVHPAIAPQAEELRVRKQAPNAFYQTPLHQELTRRGIDHLIISGMQTECCVDATCRQAIDLGYNVTLVGDAHTTMDNQVLPATQIIAYHNYVLGHLPHPHSEIAVKPTEEVVF